MTRLIRPFIYLTVFLIFTTTIAAAAPEDPRPYAPVQAGPNATPELMSAFAPGRVMVRFTESGYRNSKLNMAVAKDDRIPGNETGLVGVDALVRDTGVTAILKAHGPMNDRALAESLGVHRHFQFDLPTDADVPAIAALLAADPDIESATPDWRIYPSYVPNDFSYPANWGHDNQGQFPSYVWAWPWTHSGPSVGLPDFDADADMAWDQPQFFGSPGVIIAILDTGVDQFHLDLLQVAGYDFGDGDPNPHDDTGGGWAGHGTCCAGIAAAIPDNGLVAAGVAGGCSIMPLKVGDSAGNLYLSYAANALYHAANNGAHVASMSFGASVTSDPNMDPAIQYAYANGVTMLAATGNDNKSTIEYPAIHADVIAVGAASPCGERKRSSSNASDLGTPTTVVTDPNGFTCDGERWWGSNYCSTVQDAAGAVDVLAPTMLPTTDITGAAGYQTGDFEPWFNGTSCATPYAAGVCALIISANPGWGPAQVRTQLVNTCTDVVSIESTPGWDQYAGYGLVNANNAVGGGISPPAADFSASPTSGCLPLNVMFTDLSTGTITSWNWDFGDGMTDVVPNPMYTYPVPGTYTVTLTVNGPMGTDMKTYVDMITVDPPTYSDFSATVLSGPAPLTTVFVDATANSPTYWHWDFGDGGTSVGQFPFHTYNNPGLYTVVLTTNNACGGDSMTKVDYIQVTGNPPTAAFSGSDTTGCASLDVTFTDASTDTPTAWAWDFGDGDTASTQNPDHTYDDAGSYDVELIVTNAAGADTLLIEDYIVVDDPPLADFSAAPVAGADTLTVIFTDASTGGPDTWAWTFGDGGTSTVQSPSHTYTVPGRYTVSLTVSNGCDSDNLSETDFVVVATTTAVVEVPRRFALEQNFPNPFNPVTTIAFSLLEADHARLEVFDASGRSVDLLVDGEMAAGPHEVTWQPARGASGVYFAKLTANNKTAMCRMVLIR